VQDAGRDGESRRAQAGRRVLIGVYPTRWTGEGKEVRSGVADRSPFRGREPCSILAKPKRYHGRPVILDSLTLRGERNNPFASKAGGSRPSTLAASETRVGLAERLIYPRNEHWRDQKFPTELAR
jgi:hypothetical protein